MAMKIGVCLDSLTMPFRQALQRAAAMGVGGVQVSASGDLSPQRLSETGRRELRTLLRSFNLQLAALNCPLRHGIDVAENQEERIEHIRQVMALAFDIGTRLVVVPFPKIASDEASPVFERLRYSLVELGRHGDRIGVSIALEIGFDPADKVRDYLNGFEVGSLGVNYDPVNLLLRDCDPISSLMPLQGKILHTQARDARLATVSRTAAEVPLGAGDINWLNYFGTLTALEYHGWVIVKRESGENRPADVEAGVKFLRRVIIAT